jgi:U6 snRNA-associated Sm-like protein LSm4
MPECYIRGSTIKYLRIPDEVIDNYKEDNSNRGSNMNRRGGDK